MKLEVQKEIITTQLIQNKVPLEQANIIADCFATADIYGVTTHGANVLPAHIDRLKRGGYNLSPKFKVVKQTPAFAVIDGDNAFGPVSAKHCLDYAIDKAKDVGMFTVFSKNNNTFGPAFYYSLKAAEKGYIAIIASNSPAQMAPAGGREKMLGTNPFATVVPVPNGNPIIIDFATSIVAKSKFKEYKQNGKPLPNGWALDVNGNPTTDADKAMEGFILPMAGFKGYGISMLIDIIAGLLSGSSYLNHVGRFYSEDTKSMNIGFYLSVIDPKQVLGDEYDVAINDFVFTLRNCRAIDGQDIVLPGDDRIKFKKDNQ